MYKVNYIHLRDDTTFKLKIIDYKIDGNQLTLNFDSEVIGKYYFVNETGFFYVTNNKKGFSSIFKKSTIKETVKQNNYQ